MSETAGGPAVADRPKGGVRTFGNRIGGRWVPAA